MLFHAADQLEEEERLSDADIERWSLPLPMSNSTFEVNLDGMVVVWTVGACRNNADARLSRAGCGVYYGYGHSLNLSTHLPGRTQTNQRAELLAIILALSRDVRPLQVRTDSQYCFDLCTIIGQNRQPTCNKNADLVTRLVQALQRRSTVNTVFVKVKGHASIRDVAQGIVQVVDKIGNDGADLLACQGADLHAVPAEWVRLASQARNAASEVQLMMLEILAALRLREGQQVTEQDVPPHEFAELAEEV